MDELYRKILNLIAKCGDVKLDEIDAESRFIDDLAFDSIKIVELLVLIEDTFSIQINNMTDYMENFTTVERFIMYICELLEGNCSNGL